MSRYAIVNNDKVINTVDGTADQVGFLGDSAKLIPEGVNVSIGWGWNGSSFTEPPPPPKYVPHEVTMRQGRLALLSAGLLGNVATAINSLSEPDKSIANIEWEYSNALQRDNPFVSTLGAALGLTSDQIDDLFIAASKIP